MPLGQVRPTRTPLNAPQVRTNPNAFGQGVAKALRGVASQTASYAQSQEGVKDAEAQVTARYDQRQKNIARAKALVDLTRVTNELNRGLSESADEQGRYAAGFTDAAEQAARERGEAFLSGIEDPDLRREFEPRIENMVQGAVNTAFDYQTSAEDAAFKTDFLDMQTQAIDGILSGQSSMDEWAQSLAEFANSSPLSTLETDELLDSSLENMEQAQIVVDSRSAFTGTGPSTANANAGIMTPQNGERIRVGNAPVFVNPSMDPLFGTEGASRPDAEAEAKLARVVSGPYQKMMEIFGEGLVINDAVAKAGTSRETETSGSRHFDGTALDIDISGMSEDEKRAVLDAALQAGFRGIGLGENILHVDMRESHQAWSYDNATFGGLPVSKAESLVEGYTGGPITPDDLLREGAKEAYPNLTYQQKQSALADAEQFFSSMMQRQAEARSAQMNATIGQLKYAIDSGEATFTQLDQIREQYPEMEFETYDNLRTQIEDRNADEIAVGRFAAAVAGDGYFDPDADEIKEGYNLFSLNKGVPALDGQNAEFVQSTMLPTVERMGTVNQSMTNQLASMARSTNPERMEFAFTTLAQLSAVSPRVRNSIPENLRSDARYYADMRRDYSQDQLMELMSARNAPDQRMANTGVDAAIDEIIADEPGIFRANQIKADLGLARNANRAADINVNDPMLNQELERQFINRFRAEYRKYQDPDKAREAAVDLIKDRWGVTEAGGEEVFMQYPPEKFAEPFAGDHSYIPELLKQEFPTEPGSGISLTLASDMRTEERLAQERPPSYQVIERSAEGIYNIRDQRFISAPTPEMREELIKVTDYRRRDSNIRRRLNEIQVDLREFRFEANAGRGSRMTETIQQAIDDLEQEREALQRELENLEAPEVIREEREKRDRRGGPAGSAR